jgi:hypothetical protein
MSGERGAIIEFKDIERVTNGSGRQGVALTGEIISSDPEMREAAIDHMEHLAEATGSDFVIQDKNGKAKGKQFAVGANNWHSTWVPTGPKPPWSENPQIN